VPILIATSAIVARSRRGLPLSKLDQARAEQSERLVPKKIPGTLFARAR